VGKNSFLSVKTGGIQRTLEDYQNYEGYITNYFVILNIRELLLGYLRTLFQLQ
jgi:hypothetical protein